MYNFRIFRNSGIKNINSRNPRIAKFAGDCSPIIIIKRVDYCIKKPETETNITVITHFESDNSSTDAKMMKTNPRGQIGKKQ